MMTPIRLFIAVHIEAPTPLRNVVRHLAGLGGSVKAVDVDQLHFTLHFLGDTDRSMILSLCQALDVVASTSGVSPFDLTFTSLGKFATSRSRSPRVIFAVPEAAEPLIRLAEAVADVLSQIDGLLPASDHPFSPHLTLARIKTPRYSRHKVNTVDAASIQKLLNDHQNVDLGTSHVDMIELIESTLTSTGPIHKTVHAANLKIHR